MRATKRLLYLLPLLAFLALPTTAESQVAIGVSGGLSLANFSGDDVDDDEFDSRTGLLAGGFINVPISEILSVTSGLYYVQKGASDAEAGEDGTFKVDYVEVPVLLQVGVGQTESAAFSVFAGPRLGFETKCQVEGADDGVTAAVDCDSPALADALGFELETKGVTFGAIFGAGVRVMTSETMFFVANGGLDLGLQSFVDIEDVDIKNNAWFLQAGVGWIVGG